MEAINVASLTPISVLSDRRTEPRKLSSLYTNSPSKLSNPQRKFQKGLLLLSSVFSTEIARALTYEEALQSSSRFDGVSDFDVSGVFDSVISFGLENPVVVAGGGAIVAVPLILSQLFKKPKRWGVESARTAYEKLGSEANSQLLDIREAVEIRKMGSPNVRGVGKKPVSIPYEGKEKPSFLKKLGLKFKEPDNTTLFIIDKFDGNSELVAELVTLNGFKAAYAIKDGAEGPRGWMKSGLPWIPPKKALSLDLGDLTDALSGAIDGSDGVSVALGIAAAAGIGLLAFTEIETVLQVLGSAALLQFISKKLLFAEDRNKTLKEVDEFLTTKVAPKELVDDIKQIGITLLPPLSVTSKALPSPAEANPEPASTDNIVQKPEAVADSAPQINSIKTEVEAESRPQFSRPLSPYPYYPDFKPPTSPTPSQP